MSGNPAGSELTRYSYRAATFDRCKLRAAKMYDPPLDRFNTSRSPARFTRQMLSYKGLRPIRRNKRRPAKKMSHHPAITPPPPRNHPAITPPPPTITRRIPDHTHAYSHRSSALMRD